jgi:PTS system N-acetylglucosamine-specific IIC component
MLGIGYALDPTGWGANSAVSAFLVQSGAAILDNIGWLFAIGVAFGIAKDNHGSSALAALVGYFILNKLLATGTVAQLQGIPVEDVPFAFAKIQNAFTGILMGITAGEIYNKFSKVELHRAFAFFSGRRLVPIVTSAAAIVISFVLMYIWPTIFNGLTSFGKSFISLGPVGAGLFGFFNRLLIPLGLHHVLNAVFWFDFAGINDLGNFWNNTGTKGVTGMYMAGFFPIMMFGLIGAGLAFIHTAKPENKDKVKGIIIAGMITAFVTGVTEPLEFAFMFVAPGLYLVHAGFTALSMFLAAQFQWIAGFNFSGGAIDWLLSSKTPLANKPYMLLVLGLVFAVVYYTVFRFLIVKFDLKTPGREDADEVEVETISADAYGELAAALFTYLGGKDNLVSVDNCATRLRIEVKDSEIVDAVRIKKLTSGVLKPSKDTVQIIVGPKVEFVANELKKLV